jgi:hypothetical protein
MLKEVYGEFILKKGSILYHSSDELFRIQSEKDKPMLFCTFHPSEYGMIGDYLTLIKLKKSVSLFFMIEDFKKARIYSALSTLTNHPNANLSKKHKDQLIIYSKELKKEGFNGWFSSIENKGTVEVALINDESLFEVIKSEDFINNWKNGNINCNKINLKDWGRKYEICTIESLVKMNLNSRYENMIHKYMEYEIESKLVNNYVFQVILKNSIIKYHNYDYQKISWV